MEFSYVVKIASELHCFSPGMLAAGEDIDAVRVQLSRWVHNGRIIRLHKGWYTLNEPFRRIRLDPNVVGCTIKQGTYVSLHSALGYHGLIPEYVAVTSCVTTGRPLSIDTPVGKIEYRHIKRELFFGYRQEADGKQQAYIAAPEKALLDLFYLTPGSDKEAYIRELRLQAVETLDLEKMAAMANRMQAPRLKRAVRILEKVIDDERGN